MNNIISKLCFSTLGCAGLCLAKSARFGKTHGMSGIELRGIAGETDARKIPDLAAENAADSRALLDEVGIVPVVLGTSCKFHDPGKRRAALDEGVASAKAAAGLGIPFIRVFGNDAKPDAATANRSVIEGIGELCAAAGDVIVLLEVHGDFNRSEALMPVIGALDRGGVRNFGLIWDVAHSDRAYGSEWQRFYNDIAPWVRHVHIKDHVRIAAGSGTRSFRLTMPGDGEIPIRDIVRRLALDGYSGYFSLEWERMWHPELPPIEDALPRFVEIMNF